MTNNDTSNLLSVLVVEDDPSITRMLRFSLRAGGFGITEVSTGPAAIRLIDEHRPAAVVLDLGLSDGDGSTVLKRLQSQLDCTPVWVCISSLDQQDAASEHGPLGEHFLGKPFDPWKLVNILTDMLSKAAYIKNS
ncbi:MAG: response regulator [Chloroflexi bacterium]|nr:response regulator [Chloroflexota bacterium]